MKPKPAILTYMLMTPLYMIQNNDVNTLQNNLQNDLDRILAWCNLNITSSQNEMYGYGVKI